MDIQRHMLELEIAVQRITDGQNAIQIMVLGLEGTGSRYAGGLNAIYHYLSEAEHMLKAQLTACLDRT